MSQITITKLPSPPPDKVGWPWTESSQGLPNTTFDGFLWPRISIITPSYNQGSFIEETIRSILLQNYPNLEYIIIDGGSNDETISIIRKYEPWLAYWVSEKDKGQTDAINKGWRRSSGQWITYLNSDDTLEPNTLFRIIDNCHPTTDFIYGSCHLIDEHSQVSKCLHPPKIYLSQLVFGNVLPQPAVFFRYTMLDKIGYLDEKLHFGMDYEYWLRAILNGATFQRILPPALANFRQWTQSKTGSQQQGFQQDRFIITQKYFPDPSASDLARIAWAGANHDAAWYENAIGHKQVAIRYLYKSFALLPKTYLIHNWQRYLFTLIKIMVWR